MEEKEPIIPELLRKWIKKKDTKKQEELEDIKHEIEKEKLLNELKVIKEGNK